LSTEPVCCQNNCRFQESEGVGCLVWVMLVWILLTIGSVGRQVRELRKEIESIKPPVAEQP